jgi:hypothetical protein
VLLRGLEGRECDFNQSNIANKSLTYINIHDRESE